MSPEEEMKTEKYQKFRKSLGRFGISAEDIDNKFLAWRKHKDDFLYDLITNKQKRDEYEAFLKKELKDFQNMMNKENGKEKRVAEELNRYQKYQEGEMNEDEEEEYNDYLKVNPSIQQVVHDFARFASTYRSQFDNLLFAKNVLGYCVMTEERAAEFGLTKAKESVSQTCTTDYGATMYSTNDSIPSFASSIYDTDTDLDKQRFVKKVLQEN